MPDFRLSPKILLGLLAAVCTAATPSVAAAFSPYLVVPDPAVAEASPAYRYANMTDAQALAELDRRRVPYVRVERAPGVRAPVRLTGRLHGVYVHAAIPLDQRAQSLFEILDARLALSLDDFSALLEHHDVDELVHFTMYRPNVAAPAHGPPDDLGGRGAISGGQGARPRPGRPDTAAAPPSKPGRPAPPSKSARPAPPTKPARTGPGKASPSHRLSPGGRAAPHERPRVARRDPVATGLAPTAWAPPGTRHPAGLAVDVAMLHKRDGRWLSVRHDFHGRLGERTCGEGARVPESPDARELHALVCESSTLAIFTYVLTPDYDAAHADHFHMEIKPGVRWFLYH